MSNPSRSSQIYRFILIFAIVYLGMQFFMRQFFPEQFGYSEPRTGIALSAEDSTVKGQHHPVLVVRNLTDRNLELEDRCPMPPVMVWKVSGQNERTELMTEETVLPCMPLLSVPPGETARIDLAPWKYSLFDDYGTYEVELPAPEGFSPALAEGESQYREGIIARFSIYEPGLPTQVFRSFITKPLLNLLIFIASYSPGYDLGIAIIIVTILVKLVLFLPTQHAMEGQRKMQAVQPKLDELRKKHKDDPKKLQAETMRIWKENKVNPMQSCLPLLIQFPILIGLFYTIRDGSHLALSRHLLYEPYQNLSWTFDTQFLGLDLLLPNIWIMPPLLMVLQFLQMKLSFAISKRKQAQSGKEVKAPASQQEIQQKVMLYGLPLMIGFFALQFPSAVSLYWGISTIFAIGQQVVVNGKELK